jgi:lycopene beta-cyclase
MHTDRKVEKFDYIFIGLGASNSLVLLALLKENLLKGKSVAVIDSNLKKENDKTYCFWAHQDSEMVHDLKPIISYVYRKVQVDGGLPEATQPRPYFYIRSLDLYNHLQEKLLDNAIPFYCTSIAAVVPENGHYRIIADQVDFVADYIFDSRPPVFEIKKSADVYLHQSFYGLHIKLNTDAFDEDVFEMMDFDVEQDKHTQFVYTLPFSKSEALVELTRFGTDKMDAAYGKKIIHRYIENRYGSYDTIAEETGCIPMTTVQISKSPYGGVLHTGSRANLIKPSTGYGFRNMYDFAANTAKHVRQNGFGSSWGAERKSRFKFYDHLLLIILMKWPRMGKPIFQRLFKKQSIGKVISFLDEKTTVYSEIGIFSSLPMKPFLKALAIYLTQSNYARYIRTFFVIVSYCIPSLWNADVGVRAGYFLLTFGMLAVGLPHGAVDHLLIHPKKINLLGFITKYVAIMLASYTAWQFLPVLSLCVFVCYSAFHFGESETEEMDVKGSKAYRYFLSFLIGMCLLLFIIASHTKESIQVINQIKGIEISPYHEGWLNLLNLPVIVISGSFLTIATLYFRKMNLLFLLFILLLGMKMTLIFAFGAYFIGHHSTNSWNHLKTRLKISHARLLKQAAPFTIAAVIVFVAFLAIQHYDPSKMIQFLESEFFVFLACISLPHVVLMHFFYKRNLNH